MTQNDQSQRSQRFQPNSHVVGRTGESNFCSPNSENLLERIV